MSKSSGGDDEKCFDQIPEVREGLFSRHRNILVNFDGTWVSPKYEVNVATTPPSTKRIVSAALTEKQSEQLITAFFFVSIERTQTKEVQEAFELILFRYLICRGYMARWIGKYDQCAYHIGNGDLFRNFTLMSAYQRSNIPPVVLNELCDVDGKLCARGSKGTRSKYIGKSTEKRYVPGKRFNRTEFDEKCMVSHEGSSTTHSS